jgi:hypothetical protein
MSERYPGYDVLAKRHTPSWNEKTRQVIDKRFALPREPRYLSQAEWLVLEAICGRIVPQPRTRPPVPLAAMVDAKLFENRGDGYRDYRLPPLREAWHRGLHAIDIEARRRHNVGFAALNAAEQDALLRAVEQGRSETMAGTACHRRSFSPSGCCLTLSPSITRTRPPGTRSA